MSLLEISNLSIEYETPTGRIRAVDDVSFVLEEGEVLGIAGESGCGKTTIALSILRILPKSSKVSGSIKFNGEDVLAMQGDQLRRFRWKNVAIVPQSAMNAFDPVLTIGSQIVEALRIHEEINKSTAVNRAGDLLETVGIPRNKLKYYPHEFSGGMRQRAMIAMALALDPKIVILDEPTTALDVVTQRQILNLLSKLRRELKASFMFITHDLSILGELSDRIVVMYAGRIAEIGDSKGIFKNPNHPYTKALFSAMLPVRGPLTEVKPIMGLPPSLGNVPKGCRFHPRCPYAFERCEVEEPQLIRVGNGFEAACHLLE
jgi:oligopeptide/dipeptide ABC transporter ATP-binding protein